MKYFKFTQISKETGISWAIAQPISGPSWPDLPLLNPNEMTQLSHDPTYYIAKVSDDAVANPENHMFELSFEEYAEELKKHAYHHVLSNQLSEIYNNENDFRNKVFGKYHDTASVAGIYKYEQAKALLADENASAIEVRAEATARGVSPVVMANRIIENHEAFRTKEAKIAGIRGKILDRINSFVFNLEQPEESLAEVLSTEIVGTRTDTVFENGEMVDKEVNVTVGKYHLAIETRFRYE